MANALKTKTNGISIVFGILLGCGAVYGFSFHVVEGYIMGGLFAVAAVFTIVKGMN